MDDTRTFAMMRVWAMVTGVVLALWFFADLTLGRRTGETLPMLVTAIGGFEAFIFAQDLWQRRRNLG